MDDPSTFTTGFDRIGSADVALVGGKAAHLGELSRIEGVRVPAGFCVTTDAFDRIVAEAPSMDDRLDRLSRLKADNREAIRALSGEIRRTLEAIAIPDDLAAALDDAARANYDALSYTHRKEWVRWIEEAKKPETRATRVAKTVDGLRAGKKTH